LGKIPALERDDGPTLYDSRVITRYLDHTLQAGLYPSGARLWDTLVIEATADGISDAAVLMRYEMHVRPEASRSAVWSDAQWSKVDRALTTLEARWMSHLACPLDMGQIAVGCALGYLDLRHPDRIWAAGHPVLADWWARFRARPAMQATTPSA
jgi:glutathione S-transferase